MGRMLLGLVVAGALFVAGIALMVFKAVLSLGVGILVGYLITLLPGVGEAMEIGPITENMIPIIVGWIAMVASFFKPLGSLGINKVEEE